MKRVLVIGSGGREHAIAWKLAQSKQVEKVIIAPGNDGMPYEKWPVDLSKGREVYRTLAERAISERISLVVVGPDNALAQGIVNVFEEKGIPILGPTAEAAKIESSKIYAKEIMNAAGVPTASYSMFDSAVDAKEHLKKLDWTSNKTGWVIKADGLALGKGVEVCERLEDALNAADRLGKISPCLLIEKKLCGEEVSWIAVCDGNDCVLLDPARDYKRLKDGDKGPNTGGMGAYSPVSEMMQSHYYVAVLTKIFKPVLKELQKRNTPFKGFLYAGLMVDEKEKKINVLEFNARLGDPEAQVILPRITEDFYEICESAVKGCLGERSDRIKSMLQTAVVVVAASKGYPGDPLKGQQINGPICHNQTSDEKSFFFYAGVKKNATGNLETASGRVLGAVGIDDDLHKSREQAYACLSKINFDGMQFRKDIGLRRKE